MFLKRGKMGSENKQGKSKISFNDWTGTRTLSAISTNAGSAVLPFQDWRRFKEAFAPELISQAVSETPGPISRIVDPFGGSGTTALAAQFLGIEPTIIEVNPYLADLIEAKLDKIDVDEAVVALGRVINRVTHEHVDSSESFPGAPKTFVEPGDKGNFIFYKDVADRFVSYRMAIDAEPNLVIRRLFRVILASVAVPASNVTVSGKGRRYRQNWQNRRVQADFVDSLFRSNISQALYDLRRFSDRQCTSYSLLRGDARKWILELPSHDLAVFSPPYPNSFDYTDVYNVELWAMGYLDSPEKNTTLRCSTLRSHVQIRRDMSGSDIESSLLNETVRKLESVSSKLWNRYIPAMIFAYTSDMAIVIRGIATKMRSSGRIYMVVGDSRYAGVYVPVADILAEISPSLGFRILQLDHCRSMRVSPQQGGNPELTETLMVLERH